VITTENLIFSVILSVRSFDTSIFISRWLNEHSPLLFSGRSQPNCCRGTSGSSGNFAFVTEFFPSHSVQCGPFRWSKTPADFTTQCGKSHWNNQQIREGVLCSVWLCDVLMTDSSSTRVRSREVTDSITLALSSFQKWWRRTRTRFLSVGLDIDCRKSPMRFRRRQHNRSQAHSVARKTAIRCLSSTSDAVETHPDSSSSMFAFLNRASSMFLASQRGTREGNFA
jgi:hypothetical protein